MIGDSDLLAKDPKDFDFFPYHEDSSYHTIAEQIAQRLEYQGTDVRENVLAQLSTLDGFGASLLTALIKSYENEKEKVDRIRAVIAEHLDSIKALEKERQLEFAEFLERSAESEGTENPPLDQWLAEISSKSDPTEKLDAFFAAKRLTDLKEVEESYELMSFVYELVGKTAPKDPALAKKILAHTIEIVAIEQKSMRWDESYSGGESFGLRVDRRTG